MKPTFAVFLRAVLFVAVGSSASQAVSEVDKQSERLQVREAAKLLVRNWGGERWYTMHNKGARVPGWLRLKAEEKDGWIVLDDEMFLIGQDGQEARHLQTLNCQADEYLTPVSVYVEAKRSQKPWVIEGEVKERRLIPTAVELRDLERDS